MDNAASMHQKEDIYRKIDHLFDETPPYKDLVRALSEECKRRGYSQEATKEAIVDYFFYGSHYRKYRE